MGALLLAQSKTGVSTSLSNPHLFVTPFTASGGSSILPSISLTCTCNAQTHIHTDTQHSMHHTCKISSGVRRCKRPSCTASSCQRPGICQRPRRGNARCSWRDRRAWSKPRSLEISTEALQRRCLAVKWTMCTHETVVQNVICGLALHQP